MGYGAVWGAGVGAVSMMGCLLLSGCSGDAFGCGSDDACSSDGSPGQCEASGYCSFPDTQCPSGRRYGDLAGGGLAGVCVQDPEGSGTMATQTGGETGGQTQGQTGDPSTTSTGPTDPDTTAQSTGTPPTPCSIDPECNDGLDCNGLETCGPQGTCQSGEPACDAPSDENCASTCDEGEAGPECGVVAVDNDRDGAGNANCAAAPGGDCDDDNPAVYPDADELCDGLDNDCDGDGDLAEGLEMYGEPSITPQVAFADLAYSPADQVYGIAFSNFSNFDFFTAYDLDQTQVTTPVSFPDTATDRVFLEWSGETFVGVYRDAPFLRQQGIGANGFAGPAITVSSGNAGTQYGAGEFLAGGYGVAWNVDDDLNVRLMGSNLDPAGTVVTFTDIAQRRQPRIARSGNTFAIGWDDGAAGLGIFDQDLAPLATHELSPTVGGPIYGSVGVSALDNGFAVAYTTAGASQRVDYEEYEVDGTRRCGPITLSVPGVTWLHDLDSYDGVTAIYTAEGDNWTLHRIAAGCERIDIPLVVENVTFYGEIGDVDINASGVGIVSQIFDNGGANPRMSFRALGPNLCDAPLQR